MTIPVVIGTHKRGATQMPAHQVEDHVSASITDGKAVAPGARGVGPVTITTAPRNAVTASQGFYRP